MISKAKNGKTFLLVMDLDNSMIDLFPDAKLLLSKIEMAIVAARKAGVNVVFVQAGKQASMPIEPAPVTSYLIAPLPMDIIVKRKQVTAFVGNDLAIILRTHNAESVIFSGFLTTVVALSTLRKAADQNYGVSILSDACADPNLEVHELLIRHVFPSFGQVLTTDEWITKLNQVIVQKADPTVFLKTK